MRRRFETTRPSSRPSFTICKLQIIGEAANHLPQWIVSKYAEVPWDDVRGLRNIIVHEYYRVRLPLIWQTARESVPELRAAIQRILDAEPDD